MRDKALYIVTEGQSDVIMLTELLDCSGYNKVYVVPAGNYNSITSYVRTIRLMNDKHNSEDRIVAVFDSDSQDPDVAAEKKATMRYLTNASVDRRIGIFCFEPDMDVSLFGEKNAAKNRIRKGNVREYVDQHRVEMLENPVIKEIQSFINK